MSVTFATETFTDGAELFDQEKYQSTVTTSLDPDPIQMEKDFKRPLSQRIIPIHSHTKNVYGEYRLDDVLVRCPSEAFREYQRQQWNTVKQEAEKKSWGWTYTMLGTAACTVIGGILSFLDKSDSAKYVGKAIANSPLSPILFVAGLVGTVVSIVFTLRENSSYNQAQTQINKWDTDPVLKVGEARDEAYNKGFPYIYANKLKLGQGPSTTALFHPLQVEYEYKKYFSSFCRKLLDQTNPSPAVWMNQFRSGNPVSPAYMTYGLGYIPEHMHPVLEDYSRFESFLNDITSSYDTLKFDVRKTAGERIEANKKARNEQLRPLAEARDAGITTAEVDRDRVLRSHSTNDAQRREARATFSAIKEALENNYTRSVTPINKKYDVKIKEVESERDNQIKKLDDQKGSQLGNNYRAARELLVRAKEAWDNRDYRPVNFQQYFPYQTTQPAWANQQPSYYQQPVYQQQPAYNAQNAYQQVPQNYPGYGNQGYGHFGYGHVGQIPSQQQYYYAPQGR
jgi:hypothetical protein